MSLRKLLATFEPESSQVGDAFVRIDSWPRAQSLADRE